ncbi:unnamed protein product [Rhodiola kirilowii]
MKQARPSFPNRSRSNSQPLTGLTVSVNMAACPAPVRFPATFYQPNEATPKRIAFLGTRRNPRAFRSGGYGDGSTSAADLDGTESRTNRMFVLGMGYVGRIFAQKLQKENWALSGTCMSLEKKKKLEQCGFDVFQFDARDPDPVTLSCIKDHTHLLVSVPPDVHRGDPIFENEELWRSSLTGGNLKWLGYLSTTSVYGDCDGAWVDEDYPASPSSESAKLRLAAEEGWLRLGHNLNVPSHIFRLGGIYGPGRSAVDTILKDIELSRSQRKRMSKQYTSRVHVSDICQALKASIERPASSKIYNIVDDDPAPRSEVFAFALSLLNHRRPDLFRKITSSNFRKQEDVFEILKGEKRVSNARIKNDLGVKLLHPSYRSGLESIVNQMSKP